MILDIDDATGWEPFDIPGGSSPVEIHRLPPSTSMLVRFPSGWQREQTGHYATAEEMVVIDGSLHMSGHTYVDGDYAWFPAGYTRTDTEARSTVLALARFEGAARWIPERGRRDEHLRDDVRETGGEPSPFGSGGARLLRKENGLMVFVSDPPRRDPSPATMEILDRDDRIWAWVERDVLIPRLDGPCFVRMYLENER